MAMASSGELAKLPQWTQCLRLAIKCRTTSKVGERLLVKWRKYLHLVKNIDVKLFEDELIRPACAQFES